MFFYLPSSSSIFYLLSFPLPEAPAEAEGRRGDRWKIEDEDRR
jgi:hypothetical protein